MLRRVPLAIAFWSLLVCSQVGQAEEPSLTESLEKAIYTERTVGDLDAAIELYEKIAAQHELNSEVAARAQLHLGMVRLKRGEKTKASEVFRSLVNKYPEQDKIVKYAKNLIPPDLDEALEQIRQNYVEVLDDEEQLTAAAIRGVLHELDEYSDFISAEAMKNFQISLAGSLVGIGVAIRLEEGQIVVTTPIVNSPAFEAGLIAEDVIVTIDGVAIESFPEDQRLKEAVRRMRGQEGTRVKIEVLSDKSDEPKAFSITRRPLSLESVAGKQRNEDGWQYTVSESPTITYVAIQSFVRNTTEQLQKIVEDFETQGIDGLIIDLRNSSGGMMQSAVDCADMFLHDGVIVEVKGRNQHHIERANQEERLKGVPIAILTDSTTASAAEIFAGSLRDHGRAVIVGERTLGKGSVQNLYRLSSGAAIKLTTARFYLPSGVSLQRPSDPTSDDSWGINPSPELAVSMTEEEKRQFGPYRAAVKVIGEQQSPEFTDRVLQKAINYLKSQAEE